MLNAATAGETGMYLAGQPWVLLADSMVEELITKRKKERMGIVGK